jgi:8-oxo-dGTP pyrophosphatase MutT (NUDIX family)
MNMSSIESKIEALATASDLPQRLAAALAAGHCGQSRSGRMSPQLSYGRHAGPAPPTHRAAAVILLLFQRDHAAGGAGRWFLPLTERPATLAHHGGQISLPGGSLDPSETSHAAALRELEEELGCSEIVELLGELADCYVFASDFLITPWLAVANIAPQWRPNAVEVASVVELPIDHLLDGRSIGRLTIERGPLVFHAPCIRFGSARIWGATSVILSELADVLRTLL